MKQDIVKGETLPQEDATALAATDVPPVKVLLVEDEALIAEIVGEALTDQGYAVHSVASAEEAVSYLAAGSGVDLLFTDINLPGEMDGAMLALHVRNAMPELPVIFASGRWGLLEQLSTLPRSAILPKPYSCARACETVGKLVADRAIDIAATSDDRPKTKGKKGRKSAERMADLTL